MKQLAVFLTMALFFLLSACTKHPSDPQDPYEPLNRNVFKFNNCIDHTIYRPVSQVYYHAIPPFVQTGVTNFFFNLSAPLNFTNDLLQGKVKFAGLDVARFLINSVIGIGGLFDVATKLGLPKHSNTFSNTFAFYSDNKKSPYFIIPFLGPGTFRDAFSIPFDVAAYPLTYVSNNAVFYGLSALYFVNLRSQFLAHNKMLDTAFDPYAAMRNAYLATRNKEIQRIVYGGDYHSGYGMNFASHSDKINAQAPNEADDDFTFGDEPSVDKKKS